MNHLGLHYGHKIITMQRKALGLCVAVLMAIASVGCTGVNDSYSRFYTMPQQGKVLHSICQQIWKAQQCPQDWKSLVFIPISKKDKDKECSNDCTISLISRASKVTLKILQVKLQ